MADLSDVEQSLVNYIAQAVYPNGTANPSAIVVNGSSVNARIFRGWPNRQALDADLSTSSVTLSIGGIVATGDVVTLTFTNSSFISFPVSITYTALSTDTLSSIATALTNAINANGTLYAAGITASSASAVIAISQAPPSSVSTTVAFATTGAETGTFNPTSGTLTAMLNITVFATNIERNVTRFYRDWISLPYSNSTLTATVSGNTVTIGGALPSPFAATNIGVVINSAAVFTYSVQSTDTLSSIATALANEISVSYTATSSGAVITISGADFAQANVGVVSGIIREVKRQIRDIRISMWCPDPFTRDAVGSMLDPLLAAPVWLTMPDGTGARVRASSAPSPYDDPQKENLYRRDLVYSVEYSTSQTQQAEQITAVVTDVSVTDVAVLTKTISG